MNEQQPTQWSESELKAIYATRLANGLPPIPDPAVTRCEPGDKPAGHYDRSDKMQGSEGNKA